MTFPVPGNVPGTYPEEGTITFPSTTRGTGTGYAFQKPEIQAEHRQLAGVRWAVPGPGDPLHAGTMRARLHGRCMTAYRACDPLSLALLSVDDRESPAVGRIPRADAWSIAVSERLSGGDP